jgi:hypothetical protein
MNPWLIIAALLAVVGAFLYGEHTGAAGEIAKQKTLDDVIRDVREAAQTGAANAIAANKPVNQTIVQKATREIETNTVYHDCVNTAGQLRNINQALTGIAQPAGDSKLPKAGTVK